MTTKIIGTIAVIVLSILIYNYGFDSGVDYGRSRGEAERKLLSDLLGRKE